MVLKRYALYFFTLVTLFSKAQFNYGHQMDFGKNRIQYKDFIWTYFDYERYRVYSYQGGNEIAKYVSMSLGKQMAILEKRLDYQIDEKISILVYNTQNDFKQSNLGLSSEEQTNIGGVTRIIGDKVSIFFNGSHAELDQQIRAALAELLINKILYGGNAREMIRNSTLLYIPEWFTQGLVKYLSEGWTTYNDNIMYDGLKSETFSSFNRLSGKQAANAGHALWYFIISTYGESMIPNVLYMTRLTRSIDNAFVTTLGVTLDNLVYDFYESYQRRVFMFRDSTRKSAVNLENSVLKKYKLSKRYFQVKVSPNGEQVAYATCELNQLRVYLKSVNEKSTKRILKLGQKLDQLEDYNYPLIAWHPEGKVLSLIYMKKDALVLHTLDLKTNEIVKRPLPGFEKINSMAYSNDGRKLVFSAVKKSKGQNDIFVFTVNTSGMEQLTNDIWDDNNPTFVKNSKQIVFESNRLIDTVKASDDARYNVKIRRNMDLFMAPYPFTSKVLVRVTNTPDVSEVLPQAYSPKYITYLSDKNGIFNRYLAEFDSSIAFVDTTEHYRYFFKSRPVSNYDRNILEQSITPDASFVAERFYNNGNDLLSVSPLPKLNEINIKEPSNTWYRGYISPAVIDPNEYKDIELTENTLPQKPENSVRGIDFENYKFEGEKEKSPEEKPKQERLPKRDSIKQVKSKEFKFPIQKNYSTAFYTDYVVTQFDNSFLANNYQVFSNSGTPVYLNPGFNFVSKVGISDLFEDMRIIGGFRINSARDNEVMMSWEQRKGKVDHQLLVDRQTFAKVVDANGVINSFSSTINTHSVKYSLKYPFSPVAALRVSLLYRNDRVMALSQSDFSLAKKRSFTNMGGVRLEYIFDNTRKVMLNILNGLRAKVWTEYWAQTDKGGVDLFTSGFDVRHYQKVHRQITWCNRLAGGNSLGSSRLLFYMGGVDNWLLPKFNDNVNIVKPEQYGFQTLATNMRGFNQNIRNGNNFLLYNSELRIPLVRYFIDYPLKSDFLNNLQLIGFTDVGMAWFGKSPLSGDNTENVKTFIQNDPALQSGGSGIIITVIDNKNPLIGGMGFGFRTRLLGYFVRLDFGWGIDNWKVQDKVVGLSFATDF
jgi:hypothetical protein